MFELTEETKAFVQKEMARYEAKESALIPVLFKIQEQNNGWVPPEAVAALSLEMGIPESRVNEVFHFYTMFNKEPSGVYHVQVCANVACAMAGARELMAEFLKAFQVRAGEVTADGKFKFSAVECLGSCDTAPVMMVNDRYVENLATDSALQHLKELK